MAIIGKIREKSVLLVIIIGLALLAFIMTGYEKMSFGSEEGIGSGTVYGERIDEVKLQNDIQKFESSDAKAMQEQNKPYDQKAKDDSADKAWNFRSETTALEKEYEALGIVVGQAEFDAYLYGTDGFTVMPDLAQGFVDSLTGQFSPKMLQATIERLQTSDKPEEKQSWEDSKEYYTNKRKDEKYRAILKQGVYVTKLEAKNEYLAKNEKKSISFVSRSYSEIDDDKIKISDEALKAYYEEHKTEKKYENRTAVREVKFISIPLEPSKQDSSKFNKMLEKIKTEFQATTSDSDFVMKNSDIGFFSTNHAATFRPEGDAKARPGMTFPMSLDTVFKTAVVGQVVGPYADNGAMRISKVLDFNTKICKVRHILLSAPKGEDKKVAAAQKQADSLVKLLNKDNFEEYVLKFSQDPGSKDKGGVYEDFMDYEMVPEFSKFATDQAIGAIGTVKTDYGIHIIEVLDRKAVKYPILGVVQKSLVPSLETSDKKQDEIYSLLYKLDQKMGKETSELKKVEIFDTLAKEAGYGVRPVQINESKPKIYGFTTSFAEDKILKLAYGPEAKVGDLCSAPIKDKDKYVIAVVSSIRQKGIGSFEDVKERMKVELIKEEKAKRLSAQMVSKSLDAIAKKTNAPIAKAEVTFANPVIANGGREPEVVGFIFSGLKDGARSLPLKGESGVYVVRIDKTIKAPTTANYEIEREEMLATAESSVMNMTRAALIKKADIMDNRRFYRAGIRQ